MKTKLFNALKTAYGKGSSMGLEDLSIERAAELGALYVTTDEQIDGFVQSMKSTFLAEQSALDRMRSEHARKLKELEEEKAALEGKLKAQQTPPTPPTPPTPTPTESRTLSPEELAKSISEAVAAAIKPISDDFLKFKEEHAAKSATAKAEADFKANEYVKKYNEYADDAWERAVEVFELGGKKMSSEELTNKAMGYFSKAVSRKGVDTSKPFEGNAGGASAMPDFEAEAKRLKEEGLL